VSDEVLMRLALEQARYASQIGEPPFGAVVVDAKGNLIAAGHDTVRSRRDWTRHAEIEAVRAACRGKSPDLSGYTLVTTVEPCPMCLTAAWLARISRLVFGATMAEVAEATAGAQRELRIPAHEMNRLGGEPIQVEGGVLREECVAPFRE
jgi:tRNA(adenine34) deaminase